MAQVSDSSCDSMEHDLAFPEITISEEARPHDDSAPAETLLEELAHRLASQHIIAQQPTHELLLLHLLHRQEEQLDRAHQHFSRTVQEDLAPSSAAAWLLDNYYVALQAIRQIREDMPVGYYQQLPKLQNTLFAHYPRIYALAYNVVSIDHSQLQIDDTTAFIQAYQADGVFLTMGELWAFPTMLRLSILDHLANALVPLLKPVEQTDEPSALSTPNDHIVGDCLTSLRTLAIQDWKAFFESVCVVEDILRSDPSLVYPTMDFVTRNSYRDAIESLARHTDQTEESIARQAIALSSGVGLTLPMSHVGYYLIGAGRRKLEHVLGFHAGVRLAMRRWLLTRPTLVYLGGIGLLTASFVALCMFLATQWGGMSGRVLAVGAATFLPITSIAVTLVNWIVTRSIAPHPLPRLDFQDGVPNGYQTMVVIPTLLTHTDEIDALLQQLELHFLRNTDPHLYFALLTDYEDAVDQHLPSDDALIDRALAGITALNAKHERDISPFYLFHRERRWNIKQDIWMGWERKRGKLHEFNRLLRGHEATSYTVIVGDLSVLSRIKYVITLDADSILPEGSSHRLIATLAHPLNRAQYDDVKGKVVAGYTILQPRIEVKPTSANQSLFTQIYSGDVGLDLYTHAVSDVYQDLFGEGSYVGKGIYDVDMFQASVAHHIPENTLLSHDLFEGIHARVALVTDIVLFEEYPGRYLTYTRRLHRWIRGDWQLLPWLLPVVPTGKTDRNAANTISVIDLWKILDNLRRSLVSPSIVVLIAVSWLGLIGGALPWTLLAITVMGFPLLLSIVGTLLQRSSTRTFVDTVRGMRLDVWRWLLSLVFLPHEALTSLNAIAITLVRLFFRQTQMLRWTTAAHTARLFGPDRGARLAWREMILVPCLVVLLILLIGVLNISALPIAVPLLIAWFASPQIAYWISRPVDQSPTTSPLPAEQEVALHHLARQTWLFFEQVVGPEDHWLPPDHLQQEPRAQIAHRTSPTNIGMLLQSTIAAYDLGYIGLVDLNVRIRATFETVSALEHYRGHLLNWYDTQSLESLSPRYVSFVDSGNWAGSLIAIKQACLQLSNAQVMPAQRWHGFLETLELLEESLVGLVESSPDAPVAALRAYVDGLRQQVRLVLSSPALWPSLVESVHADVWPELSTMLVMVLESEASKPDSDLLSGLRIASECVRHHLQNMQRDMNMFLPWLSFMRQPPSLFTEKTRSDGIAAAWDDLASSLPIAPHWRDLASTCTIVDAQIEHLVRHVRKDPILANHDARLWCEQASAQVRSTRQRVDTILADFEELAVQAEAQFQAMDFRFLFHAQRNVFHIGYNVTTGRLDDNCYDLLASEARIGSLLAIAKRDVPQTHWLHLGRPITNIRHTRTLLSWSGTMFEYLMPTLLMESYEQTFLTQSCRAIVDGQIAYGQAKNVPWGISESSYYAVDGSMTYQYRAFGIPGMGFQRGLADDLVISPYASLLALRLRPQAVRHNMTHLDAIGMRGRFGYYEAADYSRARLALRQDHAIVRTYMAHHQGMILVSLANYLTHNAMVKRFHSDPSVQSVEMLLQERVPSQAPIEYPHSEELVSLTTPHPHLLLTPWPAPIDAALPGVHVFSNGRYSTLITSAGCGYSQWQGVGLTRWQADSTQDNWGTWIYLQDRDTGALWSAGHQPTGAIPDYQQVMFYPHQATFQRRDHGIEMHMEITVAPDDDVEIRLITLINVSDQPRHLRLRSYGEVLLAPQTDQHPAFSKLFVESDYVSESNLLLFHRRARTAAADEIYLGHMFLTDADLSAPGTFDGNKRTFIGRGRTSRSPIALLEDSPVLSENVGVTLDPIMSLGQDITLAPHARCRIAFVTLATRSRQESLVLAERYRSWSLITHAFDNARHQSERDLRQLKLGAPQLALIQQVLAALLYPSARLRASAEVLLANSKGQSALWAYSISGDYPILLVRVTNATELALVQDLLQAYAYWSTQQIKIDLVILNMHDSTYSQVLQGQIHRLVMRTNGGAWLNQHGGVFTVNADQMPEADRILLETTARVVLDGQNGSLADQLTHLSDLPTHLPMLTPAPSTSEEAETTPPLPRPTNLRFDNTWGGFSSDGNDYTIYLQAGQWTPAPWVNVIANETFGFLVSETGAGYTWAENSSQNRLTPWSNDPVSDATGEALYVRDEETALVWSPTPLPSRDDEPYLIRHGAGYTVFQHHSQGLRQTTQMFVAPDAPVKFIKLRLENTWHHARRITVTYYAEWVMGVTRGVTAPYIVSEYDHKCGALLAHNAYNAEFAERVVFLAASKVPHGLTTDRTEFLGRMGDPSQPDALKRIGLSSNVEPGCDPCAALQLHVDLPVGGYEDVYFLLGEGINRDEALRLIEHYQDPTQVEVAWEATHSWWDEVLGAVTVQTPDPSMDLMLNRWLLYQTLSCRIWGRTGFYQSSGAFGYRDQLQDVMAMLLSAPTIARDHILRAARHQFEAGNVLHWWHPPTARGVQTRISDDLLWLPYVMAQYVTTTGDCAILHEVIPFLRTEELPPGDEERYGQYVVTNEAYTLYEHCLRAIKRGSTSGQHGIPLMGTGDWNDGMNRVGVQGRGESVWVGWFLYAVLTAMAPLCVEMGDAVRASAYLEQARHLAATLDTEAWDGEWYRRAYYDDKSPLGSTQNQECRIDSIVQSWAVLSKAGTPLHIAQAMNAVKKQLIRFDDQLILLFTPPFDQTPHDPGYIKGYPPGIRENGGQYTHASLWVAWAFAQLGDGNQASALFNLLNPISHGDTKLKESTYLVEPYVVAADISSVAPNIGRGGWTWYTGSASWMYRLGIEAILGLTRVGDTIVINPCIPNSWAEYTLTYRHNTTRYVIHVRNPYGVNGGVRQITMDGLVIAKTGIPLSLDGAIHEIDIELGKPIS